MVLLVLYVKATLENVSKIAFPTSLPFQLSIKDPVGYDERASVTVDPQNINELENSRGEAHFVVKFEGQMKQSSIVIVDEVKDVLKKDVIDNRRGRRNWDDNTSATTTIEIHIYDI